MNKRIFNIVCAIGGIILSCFLVVLAIYPFNNEAENEQQVPEINIEEDVTTSDAIESIEEEIEPTPLAKPINEYVNLGTFQISAYCHCVKCCGKSDGITAIGTKVQANKTIAVDPRVIPLGSKVIIDGYTYVAEDTGGAIKGNRIDMYFPTHQAALDWGIRYKQVSLVKTVQ